MRKTLDGQISSWLHQTIVAALKGGVRGREKRITVTWSQLARDASSEGPGY